MQKDKNGISEYEFQDIFSNPATEIESAMYTQFHSGQEDMSSGRPIIVRDMVCDDVAAVAEIEKEAFSLPWSEKGFLDALDLENTICLAAECKGKIAGYCVLYYAADEGDISTIAVNPQFRRRGVADLLLSRIKQETERRQIVFVYLEVRISNLPARKLYEKHGFVSNGVRKNFYENPREDALLMVYQMEEVSAVENNLRSL